MRVAVHHFKRALLEYHEPGRHQVTDVFLALEKFGFQEEPNEFRGRATEDPAAARPTRLWTGKTWRNWFSEDVAVPKLQKLELLDKAAARAIRWVRPCDSTALTLPHNFYAQLVSGGMLKSMLGRTKGDYSAQLLRQRANAYKPLSAWHLHLDALELMSFRDAVPGVENEAIIIIAGERIFELLFSLWGYRTYPGVRESIYVNLASEKLSDWNLLSAKRQQAMLAEPSLLLVDDPEQAVLGHLARKPDRALLGPDGDAPLARVYRLLFAIGSDSTFLQGDALSAWAFDLATACAAAIAMFYSDSPNVTPRREQVVLNAIDSVLFGLHVNGCAAEHRANLWGGDIEEALRDAMQEVRADWEKSGSSNFHRAREAYEAEMLGLGIRVTDIYRVRAR